MYKIAQIIMILLFAMAKGHAQKVEMQDGYVVFDATGLPATAYEVRDENFAPGGRIPRHGPDSNAATKVSAKFRIAPTLCKPDGTPGRKGSTWAEAAGWNTSANSLPISETPQPAKTGCSQYKGKDNLDSEIGKWRLPTVTELKMIVIFAPVIENLGYREVLVNQWSATEFATTQAYVNTLNYYVSVLPRTATGNTTFARCIQDIR